MSRTRNESPARGASASSGEGKSEGARAIVVAADVVLGLAGIALILLLVPRFYLSIYPRNGWAVPVGSDTPTYVWRSNVVIAEGLNALPDSSPFPFDGNTSNPDRPGYPVLAAIIDSVTGVDPWRLAFVLPAVCGTTIALAACAVAVGGVGEPRWSFAIYGPALGLAAVVSLTANGYLDNLVVDGTLVAAAAAALVVADDRPAVGGAAVLLAASFALHWMFAALFTAILLGFALVLVPASFRASRRGIGITHTPSARIGAVAVLGGGLGVGSMLWMPGFQLYTSRTHTDFKEKLDTWLPYLRLPSTATAALVGAVGLSTGRDGRRLRALALWGTWLLACAAALLAFHRGITLPAQRIVGFALPLWLAAAAAGTWLIRAAWRLASRSAAWLGVLALVPAVAVVAIALVYAYRIAGPAWEHATPVVPEPLVESMRAAGPYLDGLPPGTPIVVPVTTGQAGTVFGAVPAFRRLRALAPAERASDLEVYLGDPVDLAAGKPTLRPDIPGYDAASLRYWRALEPALAGRTPVVLAISPFTKETARLSDERPEAVVAPGIVVIEGPLPGSAAAAAPLAVPTLGALTDDAARVLLLVTLVGLGWSVGLVRTELLVRAALAPAMGQATLVVAGVVAGRTGISLAGSTGVRVAWATGAAGYAFAVASFGARRAFASRRSSGRGPDAPDNPARKPGPPE
jgi:hypothetical protein